MQELTAAREEGTGAGLRTSFKKFKEFGRRQSIGFLKMGLLDPGRPPESWKHSSLSNGLLRY